MLLATAASHDAPGTPCPEWAVCQSVLFKLLRCVSAGIRCGAMLLSFLGDFLLDRDLLNVLRCIANPNRAARKLVWWLRLCMDGFLIGEQLILINLCLGIPFSTVSV